MQSRQWPAWRGWHLCLLVILLLSSCTGDLQARTLHDDTPPAAAADSGSSSSGNATAPSSEYTEDVPVDVGTAITNLLKHTFQNQSMPQLKDLLLPHRNSSRPKNFTMPKLEDFIPKNFSMKEAVQQVVNNITNGMTAFEFAKALMTGTISANTADTNTPDKGLADVQAGAININPFVDGAALSNALTLAGRDATANSKGIVFGMVGTGRSSSQATALGMSGAKSSTDTFTINGGGLNQNAMGSNLAATPQGRADTSVRSAAFNIIGHTATGGLTTALGKKGAASAGLGAGMTGLGESYSSQFADSISAGDTTSNVGVIAGTLGGAAKGTVGSVSVSSKKSAQSQSLSTAKSALGSATSKSASLSAAAQNATSHVSSVATTGVGNVGAISSTTSTGMNAKASANSNSTTHAGAANSRAHSKAVGVTSAEASSASSTHPYTSGIRDTPILWTQRRRPSTTWTTSRSTSDTARAATSSWSAFSPFSRFLPAFLQHTSGQMGGAPTTAPLLGEALVSSAALKALLPAVPKITPQLPTLNQTVQINNTAQACNETEINLNRTADMPRLKCNATNNSTNNTVPDMKSVDPTSLPGIGFFKNLKDMNDKFMADTKDNKQGNKAPAPGSNAVMASKAPLMSNLAAAQATDAFAAFKQSKQGGSGNTKPPDKGVLAKTTAVGMPSGTLEAKQPRYKQPLGPQRPPHMVGAHKQQH